MRIKGNSKGITLIVLVVTIIVMLILVGVLLKIIISEDGIIQKTITARNKQVHLQEKDYIEMAYQEMNMKKYVDGVTITSEEFYDVLLDYIDNIQVEDNLFGNNLIITIGDSRNVYTLDKEIGETKLLGSTSDIVFIVNPEEYTNGNVTTILKTNVDMTDKILQWTKTPENESSWIDYEENTEIVSSENEKIVARIVDVVTGDYIMVTKDIEIIDKIKPEIVTTDSTSNSITFIAEDDLSGIIGYAITENAAQPSDFVKCTNTKSLEKTLKNQKDNSTYYVWVKDKAGNVSDYKAITTKEIVAPTSLNLYASSLSWDETTATVTFTTTTEYQIQLTTTPSDDASWETISSITVESGTCVYARLYDGYNTSANYITYTPVAVFSVNLDNQNASTAGTTMLYAKYGEGIYKNSSCDIQITTNSNAITIPTKTNSVFLGYYTETNGNGTQMINKNGYITSDFTTTKYLSEVTLYASWHTHTGSSSSGGGCYGIANYSTCGTYTARYRCSGCGGLFTSSGTHSTSTDYATTRVYYCSTCGTTQSSTGSHTRSGYYCSSCGVTATSSSASHGTTYWGHYVCSTCGWEGNAYHHTASSWSTGYHSGCTGTPYITGVVYAQCLESFVSTTITCSGSASAYWRCSYCGSLVSNTCYHGSTCGTKSFYNYVCSGCGGTNSSSGTHTYISSYSLNCGY